MSTLYEGGQQRHRAAAPRGAQVEEAALRRLSPVASALEIAVPEVVAFSTVPPPPARGGRG